MRTKTAQKEKAIPLNRLDVITLEFLRDYQDAEMRNVKTYFRREETIAGAFITYRLNNACVGEFGKIELALQDDKTSTIVSRENDLTEMNAVIIYLKASNLPREVGNYWKQALSQEREFGRWKDEPTPDQLNRLVDQVWLYWKQELIDKSKRDYSFLPQETNELQRLVKVCYRVFDNAKEDLQVERRSYLTRLFSSLDAELARGLPALAPTEPPKNTTPNKPKRKRGRNDDTSQKLERLIKHIFQK